MNIYAGNLATATTDADLQTAFGAFGTVSSARLINDRETGQPRGFGIVEMKDGVEAQKAIDALNGTELHGKALKVAEAKRKEKPGANNGAAPADDTTATADDTVAEAEACGACRCR